MWIRSQNRTQLQDVNRFVIEQFEIGIYIVGNGCTLGIYSTKEKAFAVLDEIQERIECPYPSKITPAFGTNCYHLIEKSKFYQMPQDDEVEVWSQENCFH